MVSLEFSVLSFVLAHAIMLVNTILNEGTSDGGEASMASSWR